MATLLIDITTEDAARLQSLAREWKCSESEVVERLLRKEQAQAEEETVQTKGSAPNQAVEIKPIWEEILELMKEVPEEEMTNLPVDASENLDHYLYGAPKKRR